MAQAKPRKDAFERRTVWVLTLAVLALILPSAGLSLYGGPDWWTVAIWIAGNAALVLAIGAAGLALMPTRAAFPAAIRARSSAELVSVAIVLLWLGLALVFIDYSIIAVDAIGESNF